MHINVVKSFAATPNHGTSSSLSYLSSMLRRPQKQHRQMVCLNMAVGPIQYTSCPTSEHIYVPIREPIRALEALCSPFIRRNLCRVFEEYARSLEMSSMLSSSRYCVYDMIVLPTVLGGVMVFIRRSDGRASSEHYRIDGIIHGKAQSL